MKGKKAFVLYADYIDFLSVLSNEKIGILFRQVFEYVNFGTESDMEDETVRVLWKVIKNALDRDTEKYKKKITEREEKGKLGGIIRALKHNQIITNENIEFLVENNCYTNEFLKKNNVSEDVINKLNRIKALE